jgi:hypothetical protein
MDFLDLFEALIKLGLPLSLFSWLVFAKLYDGWEIAREGGQEGSSATTKSIL